MQKNASSSGFERNTLVEESILFRINQLQRGLLQFTDSTNAHRLVTTFGKDIRYIAPWKKWIVWDGTHWRVDNGALIHDRGLTMVRSIYAEIYKTADYRERIEIEKYAIQSEVSILTLCLLLRFLWRVIISWLSRGWIMVYGVG